MKGEPSGNTGRHTGASKASAASCPALASGLLDAVNPGRSDVLPPHAAARKASPMRGAFMGVIVVSSRAPLEAPPESRRKAIHPATHPMVCVQGGTSRRAPSHRRSEAESARSAAPRPRSAYSRRVALSNAPVSIALGSPNPDRTLTTVSRSSHPARHSKSGAAGIAHPLGLYGLTVSERGSPATAALGRVMLRGWKSRSVGGLRLRADRVEREDAPFANGVRNPTRGLQCASL